MIRLAQEAHVAEQLRTLGCSVVVNSRGDSMGNSVGLKGDPARILRALVEEYETALNLFNEVTEERLVDAAVYTLAAVERKMSSLIAAARRD